jgi:hypothetical protein
MQMAAMLKLLKRWLGWDSTGSLFDFDALSERRPAPRPGAAGQAKPQAATGARPAPERRAKKPPTPMDVLDNPKLSLDRPANDGFDPYNTGAFNRSQSWEKIGRRKR